MSSACVKRHVRPEPGDLVTHPVDPRLARSGQARLDAAVPVTRNGHRHLPARTFQNLARCVSAAAGLARRRVLAFLAAPMRDQFQDRFTPQGCANAVAACGYDADWSENAPNEPLERHKP